MNRQLRVALVGLGYRGSYLFKLLRAMSPLVELVGVADPSALSEEALQGVPLFREGERSHERLILEAKPVLHCSVSFITIFVTSVFAEAFFEKTNWVVMNVRVKKRPPWGRKM